MHFLLQISSSVQVNYREEIPGGGTRTACPMCLMYSEFAWSSLAVIRVCVQISLSHLCHLMSQWFKVKFSS